MSKWNLDFKREIVCDECTQKVVGSPEIPLRRSEKPRKAIRGLKPIKHMEE